MSKFTPSAAHLPLKIIHNFPYASNDTIERKKQVVTDYLQYIMARGFGGVVSNVCTRDYLCDEHEWGVFAHLADECERLGLRLWIYDEDGYPSGGAGGLTLAENPAFEAQGVVMVKEPIAAGETITIPLPQGHTAFLFAGVYLCDDDGNILPSQNDGKYIAIYTADCQKDPSSVTLQNPLPYNCMACAFVQKRLYEGTHSVHNVFEARRYIDVTNPDAVAAFLRNTYDQYFAHVPEHMEAGAARITPQIGQIEAFFTDEPSLMGCYINKGLIPSRIKDPFDEEMPLYPILTYGKNVANAFASTYGYDLFRHLIYIFMGDTPFAQKVRQDYYTLLSNLYENAFFAQISNWCYAHNISFSGHLLLEDNLKYHTVFEGNFFNLLRHMHFPGIDMLHSIPSEVRKFAFTPKLVSSVAHAYDRPHVMSEVSAHAQGGKVTHNEMYASLCAQYALGVDIFTYYYSENFMEPETYTRYNHALGRIDAIMTGQHIADVLLYYPIDTMRRHHKPSADQYGAYTQAEKDCEAHLFAIMDTLLDNQIDFDFVDNQVLSQMSVDGIGRMVSAPQNEVYHLLILPPMDQELDISAIVGKELADRMTILTLTAEDMAHLDKLPEIIQDKIPSTIPTPLAVKAHAPHKGVLKLSRFVKTQDSLKSPRACLFVNTNPTPESVCVDVYRMTNPVLYDPMADEILSCDICPGGNSHTITFTLDAYQSVIIKERNT